MRYLVILALFLSIASCENNSHEEAKELAQWLAGEWKIESSFVENDFPINGTIWTITANKEDAEVLFSIDETEYALHLELMADAKGYKGINISLIEPESNQSILLIGSYNLIEKSDDKIELINLNYSTKTIVLNRL